MQELLPYCGSPPAPAELLARWNLDPVLIAALALAVAAYAVGARRAGAPRLRRLAFYAGWAVAGAAVISPLCPLSVSLFAARIGQHMLIMLVSAPLVAFGRPLDAYRALAGAQRTQPAAGGRPMVAAALFGLALWYWHAPEPYTSTFHGAFDYWLMHLSLFLGAAWVWTHLINRPASAASLGAAALTMLQMGFLGSLIALAPQAIYPPHAATTAAWGLSPLQDQQLGGAIMWVPGGVVFMAAAFALGAALLRRAGPATGREAVA